MALTPSILTPALPLDEEESEEKHVFTAPIPVARTVYVHREPPPLSKEMMARIKDLEERHLKLRGITDPKADPMTRRKSKDGGLAALWEDDGER